MLFLPDEDGQSLVEYGLVIILVAIVVVAILTVFGDQVWGTWNGLVNELVTVFS